MQRLTRRLCGLYAPVVGCIFLVDTLYGSKYSPHIGVCNLPYAYVKTLLFCVSGRERPEPNRQYVLGLIEHLVPFNGEEDLRIKLELTQFVETVQLRTGAAHAGTNAGGAGARCGSGGGSSQLSENMTAFLSGSIVPPALARVLLYDAVCACADDGEYSEAERTRVSHVAATLSIPQRVRDAIEKVVVQERLLAMRKRRLLLVSDTPPPR
ncbi:hypothetical protein TraAM80_03377 [Trypanosoma rangeli]|uniref:Co-chaperone DjlA N-terminal domain-containing protein n=1 Tax=Trypanosoma rangeli TaxID=5698 RepID=A0A3R7MK43_TRYRA|nr:uncharacterized protein TraAM80_03377 [Trypanosoma rangeli]RNF07256.1 hypothetical protein TraAM80_03377 [Trypanosoma rangeli]|eukprot:RNF07256.1 hypothetical protein TraAM80_03377 [Trypanosoma rangeli]